LIEEWLKIKGFSRYSISSLGRIRRDDAGVIRRLTPDHYGYPRVCIDDDDGKYRTVKCHRAVALAFLGPPPTPKHHVAHKDGNRANPRLDNLRWATATENNRDKVLHGKQPMGSQIHCAKLTEDIVREMRRLHAAGEKQSVLSRKFGLHRVTTARIVHRQTWKHVA
jgi:hypothetical protein